MARYDDFDYGDPTNRADTVRRHLARIGLSLDTSDVLGAESEDPAVAARKERERKARLAEHDRLFGVTWGGTLGLPRHVSAGDERED